MLASTFPGSNPSPSSSDTKMKALFLTNWVRDFNKDDLSQCLEVREVNIPAPGPGEVLVRMEFSPINPADLMIASGQYSEDVLEGLPCQLGLEGSGTVVQSGGGVMSWLVKGKRVALLSPKGRTWAEYAVVPAKCCVAINENTSFEEACGALVNPVAVNAFIEIAKSKGVKCIVHTAAASALGRQLVRHARDEKIDVICVVRSPEQMKIIQDLGVKTVVNTSEIGWRDILRSMCQTMEASLAFDAVGGELTNEILSVMPNGSELRVYGCLSQKPCTIDARELIFKQKCVSGFWIQPYLTAKNIVSEKMLLDSIVNELKDKFSVEIQQSFDLSDAIDAIKASCGTHSSEGKIVLRMQKKQHVVILGSSGAIGASIVTALSESHYHSMDIAAAVKDASDPRYVNRVHMDHVAVCEANMQDCCQCLEALRAADRVVLVVPEQADRVTLAQNAVEAAKRANVKYIAAISNVTADRTETVFGSHFFLIERAVRDSGIPYTIIRLPPLMENNLCYMTNIQETGRFYNSISPHAFFSSIAVRDVGIAAANILANPEAYQNTTLVLGGTRISPLVVADTYSKLLQKPVKYKQIPDDQMLSLFIASGFPEWLAHGMIEANRLINDGKYNFTNSDFKTVVGRDPMSFEQCMEHFLSQNQTHGHNQLLTQHLPMQRHSSTDSV